MQYDLSVSTFSPDGRVFQTDYAQKAVDNSGLDVAAITHMACYTMAVAETLICMQNCDWAAVQRWGRAGMAEPLPLCALDVPEVRGLLSLRSMCCPAVGC